MGVGNQLRETMMMSYYGLTMWVVVIEWEVYLYFIQNFKGKIHKMFIKCMSQDKEKCNQLDNKNNHNSININVGTHIHKNHDCSKETLLNHRTIHVRTHHLSNLPAYRLKSHASPMKANSCVFCCFFYKKIYNNCFNIILVIKNNNNDDDHHSHNNTSPRSTQYNDL